MIYAFAIEPDLVATWGRREDYRFIHDKFGIGTPRVFLELPTFSKWKKAVHDAATKIGLQQQDLTRIVELFKLFSEHKHQRGDSKYDGNTPWLENAEREHSRRPFAGILATENPRNHIAVLSSGQIGPGEPRWTRETGAVRPRTPAAIAGVLTPMITNCRELHLVDPHFGPENPRHQRVLEAILKILDGRQLVLNRVCVHCSGKAVLAFFEEQAAKMAPRICKGHSIEFVRWRQKPRGQRFHNRYVLTDIGGVMFGDGLDDDNGDGVTQTDDIHLLSCEQYRLRWDQYVVGNGAFDCIDRPARVIGNRV